MVEELGKKAVGNGAKQLNPNNPESGPGHYRRDITGDASNVDNRANQLNNPQLDPQSKSPKNYTVFV